MKIAIKKNKDVSIYTITIHDTYNNYMYEVSTNVDINGNIIPRDHRVFDYLEKVKNSDEKIYYKFSDGYYFYVLDENITLKDFASIDEMFKNFMINKHEVLKLINQYNEKNEEKIKKKELEKDQIESFE